MGHAITAVCIGFSHSLNPPKYSAGLPFVGYDGKRIVEYTHIY